MTEWTAPAKLNLDLRVRPPDGTGLHPLRSLVQTIEWCDRLVIHEGDEDHLDVRGASLPEEGENLVWKAVDALGLENRPPLHIELDKRIPVAAGLGGGSSDAATVLLAVTEMVRIDPARLSAVAMTVGADVPFLLTGGTALMEGHGDRITPQEHLRGFWVSVAVPPFELSTAEVFRRWDELGGPVGEEVSGTDLPPELRSRGEMRNDLVPAALSLRAELGDWIADLEGNWDRRAFMSGSGPACFGFFMDEDEASEAATTVVQARSSFAAGLRRNGPRPLE